MLRKRKVAFDVGKYLSSTGPGRSITRFKAKQIISFQGEPANGLFYLSTGRAKLTVVFRAGKEATVTLLAGGDFFGEECMIRPPERRATSATATTICAVLKIDLLELTRVLRAEHAFSDLFVQFVSLRSSRTQADLIPLPETRLHQLQRPHPGS